MTLSGTGACGSCAGRPRCPGRLKPSRWSPEPLPGPPSPDPSPGPLTLGSPSRGRLASRGSAAGAGTLGAGSGVRAPARAPRGGPSRSCRVAALRCACQAVCISFGVSLVRVHGKKVLMRHICGIRRLEGAWDSEPGVLPYPDCRLVLPSPLHRNYTNEFALSPRPSSCKPI